MNYKHLSLNERHYIAIQRKDKVSAKKIAKDLNRSQSTISREIKRNKGERFYSYKKAEEKAFDSQRTKNKFRKLTPEIIKLIEKYIKQDWSPEQICGRLKKEGIADLHHETIYRHILHDKANGGTLYTHLRHKNKTYRKRYGNAHNRTGIPNRTDIDERPEIVNTRSRFGDWEADTMIGKNHKGAFLTLDERLSKLRMALPMKGKKAEYVSSKAKRLLVPIRDFVKTITFDNGKEFCSHQEIAESIGCDTYFAKPYHSWERGQNENANGLLRQYFPKEMELVDISNRKVFDAVNKLNSRPRKCLGYKTPYEVFEAHTGINMQILWGYALMT